MDETAGSYLAAVQGAIRAAQSNAVEPKADYGRPFLIILPSEALALSLALLHLFLFSIVYFFFMRCGPASDLESLLQASSRSRRFFFFAS